MIIETPTQWDIHSSPANIRERRFLGPIYRSLVEEGATSTVWALPLGASRRLDNPIGDTDSNSDLNGPLCRHRRMATFQVSVCGSHNTNQYKLCPGTAAPRSPMAEPSPSHLPGCPDSLTSAARQQLETPDLARTSCPGLSLLEPFHIPRASFLQLRRLTRRPLASRPQGSRISQVPKEGTFGDPRSPPPSMYRRVR